MPITIRQLPAANISSLVDKNSVPQNTTLFNPSRGGRYIYIRSTVHSATGERNEVIIYDTELSKSHTIQSPWSLLKPTVNLFKGIEDLRITEFQGKLWFTGTCTHASDHQINDLIMGHFSADFSRVERCEVVEIGSRPVKNVCPFVRNDALYILDVFFQRIYAIDIEMDAIVARLVTSLRWGGTGTGSRDDHQNLGSILRGSTSPVHLHGNIWGVIVHDIIYRNNKTLVTRLSYIHYWMELDMELGLITFISTPFYIAHWGIEYISGIHREKDGFTLSLYFGVEDRLAMQCKTTLTDLRVGY